MDVTALGLGGAVVAALVGAAAWSRRRRRAHPLPDILRPGKALPEFRALDEQGNPVRSTELLGAPAVILFVRGGWCPFCNEQVERLTAWYREIVDMGANLIIVTPKPLETTRRVARFFEVEFEFWLDESLEAAEKLGLLHTGAVPAEFRAEYGSHSVWPAALVVDAAGVIRHVALSKRVSDRPDPRTMVEVLRDLREAP